MIYELNSNLRAAQGTATEEQPSISVGSLNNIKKTLRRFKAPSKVKEYIKMFLGVATFTLFAYMCLLVFFIAYS